ncbi:hypothetical protein PspLS_05697 [Pyricularia sp. CBS 133598]|nr:hypothetical protein PspLS_05697 [Pyricularia sp. CBS 133598]
MVRRKQHDLNCRSAGISWPTTSLTGVYLMDSDGQIPGEKPTLQRAAAIPKSNKTCKTGWQRIGIRFCCRRERKAALRTPSRSLPVLPSTSN